MPKASAGLVLYRRSIRTRPGTETSGWDFEFLLVHLGGPLWSKKDAGAWFIPKGEIEPGEDPLQAAKREFEEETGLKPSGPFSPLGDVRQKSGKIVTAWGFEGDFDPAQLKSNTFTMEWPPKSGRQAEFPEIDRAGFFTLEEAREKMFAAEFVFLTRLGDLLKGTSQ